MKNKEPWCSCCSNDHVMEVAHDIVQYVVTKHYGRDKNMCIGSISDTMNVAAHLLNAMSAKVGAHRMADQTGMPIALTVMIAGEEQEIRRANVIHDFNHSDDAVKHVERMEAQFETKSEMDKADKAFAERKDG